MVRVFVVGRRMLTESSRLVLARSEPLFDRPPLASPRAGVQFPSLRATRLLAVLMRAPLNYEIARQKGSHRKLTSASGYPSFTFSWHDRETLPGGVVKEVLTKRVGLTESDGFELL